ncbi:hypothetical protein TBR22_A40800 [Luteitalea sp. TBR-22]|uniref:hypothetical protein n=1 Tax=Luteitalea sp. TBR-22 TaxID=2802971 RepID=UPI001AFA3EAA|nr:hypothetical protein [Luteitalea sp. TBR-22]BCS34854.1 hypothetical protein TBR22_A40800 [Luteitalea sp. TBR-22]
MSDARRAPGTARSEAGPYPLLLAGAAAGAMGWGIRGQYGHETGAMIAGLLVSLAIVLGLRPRASSAWAMRAVAFGTIGVGFGGAMTYGQTIGLTQDAALVGNLAALRWGLTGLAVKGAVWIGFFGACLGMGLGTTRYRSRELALLMLALVAVAMAGVWLLNEPYVPAERLLPRLYFSASWYWRPDVVDLKPRREVWGGLLLALAALGIYTRWRGDRLAPRLLGWGLLGGALGFPLGQCLQAYHAWHPDTFSRGLWAAFDPFVNWWNAMETTFGGVMGLCVALGAWRHRALVAAPASWAPLADAADVHAPGGWLSPWIEWTGLAVHVALLTIAEFTDLPGLGRYADVSLLMGVLPLALVTTGRWSPAAIALPVTLLPIAGKTAGRLVFEQHQLAPPIGVFLYVVLPLGLACGLAWWLVRGAAGRRDDGHGLRVTLLASAWLYFWLNFAFFDVPWPWAPWTTRTIHALVFFACACVLTWHALRPARGSHA